MLTFDDEYCWEDKRIQSLALMACFSGHWGSGNIAIAVKHTALAMDMSEKFIWNAYRDYTTTVSNLGVNVAGATM